VTFSPRTTPIRRRHRQCLLFLAGKNAAFQSQWMPASLATRSRQSLAGSSSRATSGRGAGIGAPPWLMDFPEETGMKPRDEGAARA